MKLRRVFSHTLASCLSVALILATISAFAVRGRADSGQPIIVSFGQPNIWSLEQAHYLLARLRSQSLLLQSKEFAQNDLDPNETNGTRLNLLKEMLGVSVGFNQAAGFQNEQATKEATFNQERRHQLLALRDQRQLDLHNIDEQLANLRVDRERMNTDTSATDATKHLKDTEIEQAVAHQSTVTSEISSINTEITGLGTTATTLATPTPPSASGSPLPAGVVDKLLETEGLKNELNALPKLNASTKLDNYLNLQYEIIAKQLSLLRDEVGPGQRLVFLELPQSFYTVPDKANRKMAQVWWRVDKYYKRNEKRAQEDPAPCADEESDGRRHPTPRALADRFKCNPYGSDAPTSEQTLFSEIKTDRALKAHDAENVKWQEIPATNSVRALDLIPRQSALNVNDIQDREKNFNILGLFTWLSGVGASISYQREQKLYSQFLQQEVYASAFGKGKSEFGWTFGPRPGTQRIAPGLQNTYAILVVPETAEALTLSASGCYFPRTDYAPNNFADTDETGQSMAATSSRLQCTPAQSFDLVVPSTSTNNFWITGINYTPVRTGARATVYLHGDYFSPQIGVLVNGVALRHSIGLAQSELAVATRDNSFAPTPIGDFEFVNAQLLVLSFVIPDFKGTPSIALVTPGRARVINNLRLVINDSYKCSEVKGRNCPQALRADGSLVTDEDGKPVPVTYKKAVFDPDVDEKDSIWVRLDRQAPMFSDVSPTAVLSVDALKVFEPAPHAHTFKALITGSRFTNGDEVRINGRAIGQIVTCDLPNVVDTCLVSGKFVRGPKILAPGLLEVEFPATNDSSIEITVIHPEKNQKDNTYSTRAFPNPLALRVDKTTVLGFQGDPKLGIVRVQLEGTGFSSRIKADAEPDATVLAQSNSFTNMILDLKIRGKAKFVTVVLTDVQTGVAIPVVIAPPPQAEQEDKGGDSAKPSQPVKKPARTKHR